MNKILILTDFTGGYGRNLLRGIVRYAHECEDWTFYRMPIHYRITHGDKGVVEWARKWKADAIIAQLNDINIDILQDLNIPIILQNYKARCPKVCNLTGDYIGTGKIAADFYINKGFVNFAYYGTLDTVWSRERGEGFKNRLSEFGFDTQIYYEIYQNKDQFIYDLESLGKWLLTLSKPTALFACDDQFALQISETCKIYNIAVPQHISILGVDNDELLCNISTPPLSSIILDSENGGYAVGKLLHQLINKEIIHPFDIIINPIRIENRLSTDLYAIKDKYILEIIKYIETKYSEPICVNDLIKLVPLSRRILENRFKTCTGISIYQFIQRHRVECFANLLIKDNRKVEELAFICGFEDYKNVSRVFMKFKRLTPTQYRTQYKRYD
jgi:LacI family transcriptional regulator